MVRVSTRSSGAVVAALLIELACALETPAAQSPVRAAAEANVLPMMVGEWTFTLGSRRGTREVTALYGDHTIEFSEVFDDRGTRGRGLLAFDAAANRYLSMAVHNVAGAAELSVGTPHGTGAVVFRPMAADPAQVPTESWLRVLGDDRFEYELRQFTNGEWRTLWTAAFVRKIR